MREVVLTTAALSKYSNGFKLIAQDCHKTLDAKVSL